MAEFEWDKAKERDNLEKHGVSFDEATLAFDDPHRLMVEDVKHSEIEERWVCLGMVHGKLMTVRFTHRGDKIRIYGAAYWRRGRKTYEKKWSH